MSRQVQPRPLVPPSQVSRNQIPSAKHLQTLQVFVPSTLCTVVSSDRHSTILRHKECYYNSVITERIFF